MLGSPSPEIPMQLVWGGAHSYSWKDDPNTQTRLDITDFSTQPPTQGESFLRHLNRCMWPSCPPSSLLLGSEQALCKCWLPLLLLLLSSSSLSPLVLGHSCKFSYSLYARCQDPVVWVEHGSQAQSIRVVFHSPACPVIGLAMSMWPNQSQSDSTPIHAEIIGQKNCLLFPM